MRSYTAVLNNYHYSGTIPMNKKQKCHKCKCYNLYQSKLLELLFYTLNPQKEACIQNFIFRSVTLYFKQRNSNIAACSFELYFLKF